MSRTRRFLGGVGVGYTSQVVITLVGLWLTPFLLGRLGSHDYGLWLTAAQLIAYLTLLDLGVLALLPRDAAYATGRAGGGQDAPDLPDLIGRTARLVLWQMPLITVAAIAAWWCLPAAWGKVSTPLAVVLGAFVLTYPLRIFQATLQGLQDLAFVGGLQLAAWALGLGLTVQLVLSGWGIGALAAGALLTQLVSLGGCSYRIATQFPRAIPRRLPRVAWTDTLQHVHRALWVSASQVGQALLYGTDLLIVAWIFGPAAVVPYACTQKLIAVLSNQPQVLTQAAAPALSELRMGATRDKLFSVTSALSLALMLTSGAVLVMVVSVNRAFVTWWVGGDLYGGAVLTGLFVSAMLVRHWNTALVYSLFSFGYERRLSLTLLGDGAVTLALSLLFAKVFGVTGVPLGFLGGALLVSVPANVTALARETGVSPLRFASTLLPWAVRLALLIPIAVVLNLFAWSPNIFSLAGVAAIIGASYAVLMLPVALRPPLGQYVRRGFGPLLRYVGQTPPAPQPVLPTHEPGPLA